MARPYRSRSELFLDLLRTIRDEGEAHTNRVLLLANLSYARLQALVGELEQKGWVERVRADGKTAWRLTAEGANVLRSLEEVDDLMRDFGLRL